MQLVSKQREFLNMTDKQRKAVMKLYNSKPRQFLACDFECTTLEYEDDPVKVWLVTVENVETKEQHVFYTIDEFIVFIRNFSAVTLYFHNGNRYDFHFLIYRVLQMKKNEYKIHTNRNLRIQFLTPYYEIDGRNGKLKDDAKPIYNDVHLLDTRDVIQGSIKKLGESFDMLKGFGEIETPLIGYHRSDTEWGIANHLGDIIDHRTDSFHQAMIENGWLDYGIQDTAILAEGIRRYGLLDDYANNRFSASSKAWGCLLENDGYKRYLDVNKHIYKRGTADHKLIKSALITYKESYKGGIAWCNEIYKGTLLRDVEGYYLDYTSMYPSIYMQSDKYPLPSFTPCAEATDLYIIEIERLVAEVKDGCFPLLKKRVGDKTPNSRFYLNHFDGKITLTSVEVEYMKECYDFEIIGNAKITYFKRHTLLENALREHGEKWFKVKNEAKESVERNTAKLQLNSVYGYLAYFNSERPKYEYKIKDGYYIREKIGDVDVGMAIAEVPAAAFITAYGRVKLARDINAIGVRHVLCTDTDSVIVIGLSWEELTKRVSVSDKLGEFKLECSFDRCISLAPKTYCLGDGSDVPIKQATAGSNYKFKDIKNFKFGIEIPSSETLLCHGGCRIIYKRKRLAVGVE